MSSNRSDRLAKLEAAASRGLADQRRIQEDADFVQDRLFEIAGKLSEAEAAKTLEERLNMSCASHMAWALRFAPGTDPREILALHGVG